MADFRARVKDLGKLQQSVLFKPGLFRRATISAMKSLSWHIQKDLQFHWQKGDERLGWKPRNPHTPVLNRARNKIKARGGHLKWKRTRYQGAGKRGLVVPRLGGGALQPFPRFSGGIRYKADWRDLLTTIGFVNATYPFQSMLRKLARGYETPVTPRSRRRAFALGFPLKKSTTVLRTPGREGFGKVYEAWKDKAPLVFATQFWRSVNRYRGGG
jgi:hypothetical protein